MQKVRLELDELQVQSFTTTGPTAQQRGTVHGNDQCTCQCCPTDPALNTCAATCPDTCWGSCGGSCDCGSGDCGSGDCGSGGCGTYDCGGSWGGCSFLASQC
jgi:hypothetical protein